MRSRRKDSSSISLSNSSRTSTFRFPTNFLISAVSSFNTEARRPGVATIYFTSDLQYEGSWVGREPAEWNPLDQSQWTLVSWVPLKEPWTGLRSEEPISEWEWGRSRTPQTGLRRDVGAREAQKQLFSLFQSEHSLSSKHNTYQWCFGPWGLEEWSETGLEWEWWWRGFWGSYRARTRPRVVRKWVS